MAWTKVGNLTPPTNTAAPVEPYARPADWLPLPAVNDTDQKIVGLHAVFPFEGGNFVALSCAGAYTVDWGDGTAPENFAANVQANHLYTYASVSASTATSRGYRQVIATITPQAGQTLTAVNLGKKHTQPGLLDNYSTGWLDVCMAGASVATLQLGMDTAANSKVLPGSLEQFEYKGLSAITNISFLFGSCYSLVSLKGPQFTANVITAGQVFYQAYSIRSLVDLNLSKLAVDGLNMFASLPSLQRVSGLNLSKVTSANSMFMTCPALVEVSNINLAAATNLTSMFEGCTALRAVSTISAPVCTLFTRMFALCSSLQTVTGLTTTAGVTYTSMFTGCSMLTSIGAMNMAAGTTYTTFVANCISLSSIDATGIKATVSFASCRLSSAALNALYTQLGTAGATITVTGNYGTTGDNPSIATAKGWTVTGS